MDSDNIDELRELLAQKDLELCELQQEFDEFRENSHDLEKELEAEVQTAHTKISELQSRWNRLHAESENTKERFKAHATESGQKIQELQDELAQVKQSNGELRQLKRAMEQENDDLQRSLRELTATITDLNERLEKAVESALWMQEELDERAVEEQRLKDEMRDLRSELAVRTHHSHSHGHLHHPYAHSRSRATTPSFDQPNNHSSSQSSFRSQTPQLLTTRDSIMTSPVSFNTHQPPTPPQNQTSSSSPEQRHQNPHLDYSPVSSPLPLLSPSHSGERQGDKDPAASLVHLHHRLTVDVMTDGGERRESSASSELLSPLAGVTVCTTASTPTPAHATNSSVSSLFSSSEDRQKELMSIVELGSTPEVTKADAQVQAEGLLGGSHSVLMGQHSNSHPHLNSVLRSQHRRSLLSATTPRHVSQMRAATQDLAQTPLAASQSQNGGGEGGLGLPKFGMRKREKDPFDLLNRMMFVTEDISTRLSTCQATCKNLIFSAVGADGSSGKPKFAVAI